MPGPQLPHGQADRRPRPGAFHVGSLARGWPSSGLAPGGPALHPRIGRAEDVVLAGGDASEHATRQARFAFRDEVHRVVREVVVVAGTLSRCEVDAALALDTHEVPAPRCLSERP